MSQLNTVPITKIRSFFGDIVDKARYSHQPCVVTKQNKPAAIILGIEDYYGMVDIMDTMAEQLSPEFQKSLLDGKKDIEEGRGISFADLKKTFQVK